MRPYQLIWLYWRELLDIHEDDILLPVVYLQGGL